VSFAAIAGVVRRVFYIGRIEFQDVFGRPHWVNFCDYFLTTGAFARCNSHNEEDVEKNPDAENESNK